MKALLCVGSILLLLPLCRGQQEHGERDVHDKSAVLPACPEGKACTTFRQMWQGGDRALKTATWACFDLPQDLPFGLHTPSYDDFFLLRDGVSVFGFMRFYNGIENVSATAIAESFRNGVAHWKPDGSGASLDVVKSEDELTLDLHYTSTSDAGIGFHIDMRLSSGRYTSKWTTEKKHTFSSERSTDDNVGQCILLPKLIR